MSNTNFNFISDSHTRSMVINGYTAVSQLELWDWMKNYSPPDTEGFMWTTHPNVHKIGEKMEALPNAPGHSGSSFALTMRILEFIAKHGIEEYKKRFPPM
jgi:hypothetical protein